jgi:hypothetical protein
MKSLRPSWSNRSHDWSIPRATTRKIHFAGFLARQVREWKADAASGAIG